MKNSKIESALAALQRRNSRRVSALKQQMGSKWICHPDNHVQRKPSATDAFNEAMDQFLVESYRDQWGR